MGTCPSGQRRMGMCPLGPCGAGSPPVPRAGFGTAGPRLGTVSHRRTLPSISQPPPQGTIHLHSIFTPLHMFPFQPRIIFYHQITAAIRWSRCDSEQSSRPPLSPPGPARLPPVPPQPPGCAQAGGYSNVRGLRDPRRADLLAENKPQPTASAWVCGGSAGKLAGCPAAAPPQTRTRGPQSR